MIERSPDCPQCGSPSLFVVQRPEMLVECLACGRRYQFDLKAVNPLDQPSFSPLIA
jgi:uncharacterized Zn finger protein